ncbi:MAG: M23 family metallopeptidase [Cryomorphaceae bacterium]|nr:MAG: M23 family metallopeptidase [Cryomorphaceae bacterium]
MSKVRYKYNPSTLNYEKVEVTTRDRLRTLASYMVLGLFFAALILLVSYTFFDSPKEKMLRRENAFLRSQYELLNKDLSRVERVLADIENRDDNIYRTIFEAEPISQNVRNMGVGGINRYQHLEGYSMSDLVIDTRYQLDRLEKRLYIQSKSFDEVIDLAKNKELLLASIPAIQPVNNKELKRMASGFGNRIHPLYKVWKMHWGMDFSAPIGTEIYATGDGVVKEANIRNSRGYGRYVVIDHGFGYETLYAHMSKLNVRKGQKVKRGEVIGLVGNTGTSSAPHLHYEVIKDGKKINPINFFFNDLSPEEYDRMIEMSAHANQSFD